MAALALVDNGRPRRVPDWTLPFEEATTSEADRQRGSPLVEAAGGAVGSVVALDGFANAAATAQTNFPIASSTQLAAARPQIISDPSVYQDHRQQWHLRRAAHPIGPPPMARSFLQPLQEWEGVVTSRSGDRFTARLTDLTAGSPVEEERAEFLVADVPDADIPLIKEGALFRWVIGYRRDETGSKEKLSKIVFRRLPAWTKSDIAEAERRASYLENRLRWE